MTKSKDKALLRGEIYWIELDPTLGTEIKKTRPCLILSINAYNKKMPRVIIFPITSQIQNIYPFQILVDVNGKKGKVMTDQVRCVDKIRIKGKIGELDSLKIQEVEASIKLCLGL
jgi:mRNA interferase MazF